jgi:hypothetical protein
MHSRYRDTYTVRSVVFGLGLRAGLRDTWSNLCIWRCISIWGNICIATLHIQICTTQRTPCQGIPD